MGEILYLENYKTSPHAAPDVRASKMPQTERQRIEAIRDNIEELLNMVAGLRRDPESVALAASRFGIMRMYQIHGRAHTMAFVDRCIETAEMAEDILGT
jgi:predicted component of type VI protein secretion system